MRTSEMGRAKLTVEASAVIGAAPAQVYPVFADYINHHPRILPRKYFTRLDVEKGGYGAGTVLNTTVKVMGVAMDYHMVVTEPAPGSVLAETDAKTGLVTTYTISPLEDGTKSRVTITTVWMPQPGLAGVIEKLTTPPVMRRIYNTELRQVANYVSASALSGDIV